MAEAKNFPAEVREEELRTAMAMIRAMEWIEKTSKPQNRDGQHGALVLSNAEALFHNTHHYIFQDWNGNGDEVSGKNRQKIRDVLSKTLFSKNEAGKPNGLFDDSGFVIHYSKSEFAEKLTTLYENLRSIDDGKLFKYGNKLSLDVFMVALSKLPVFSAVCEHGIDFRRLDEKDLAIMADQNSSHRELVTVFEHATDPSRTRPLENKPESLYKPLENKSIEIGGVPFLSHEENGVTYLVTVNGGLIKFDDPLYQEIYDHLSSEKFISEFKKKPEKYMTITNSVPLNKRAELQQEIDNLKDKKEISGVRIDDDGKAPLVCLDVDIMSGLRKASHDELLDFLKNNKNAFIDEKLQNKKTIEITDLFNEQDNGGNESAKKHFLEKLKERASSTDGRLNRMLDIAYDRVNANVRQINEIVRKQFDGKERTSNPKMYMSMGGSGSGKSVVENIVQTECGNNFVVSSLDNFREYNDMQTLLLAVGHHADDYRLVEPYAKTLRAKVTDKALKDGVNILYDGSGVDYKGRYDEIVDKFKKAGFDTNLVAIETDYQTAVKRVEKRYDKEWRAIPHIRVATKHINFPQSFMDAIRDDNIDKASLIATDRGLGEQYLIAETMNMERKDVEKLKAQKGAGLKVELEKLWQDKDSVVQTFSKVSKTINGDDSDKNKPKDITNIPDFSDENASFITYQNIGKNGKDRVLAVYNISRLAGMMEKGQFNENANSPTKELLQHTKDAMPFYAPIPQPSDTQEGAWQLRLKNQPSSQQQPTL